MELLESTEVLIKENAAPRRLSRIEFALLVGTVLCLLLLVTCIVLGVLYSQEVRTSTIPGPSTAATWPGSSNVATPGSSTKSAPTTDHKKTPKKYEICDDEKCFNLGLEMVKNMNKSVDPCEDFYAYACGGWQRRHPLKYASDSTTVSDVLSGKFPSILKKALEQAHLNYSKNDAVMKMVRTYNSCLSTTAIDALGLQPLKDLIKEYGGWSISRNYDPSVSVAQRIGRAARELNIDSLFGMDVGYNRYDSDVNVLMLKESALGLNKKDYLGLDDKSKQKRKKYKSYMKSVSQMFNAPYAKMEAIYDLEVKLAKIVSGKSLDTALKDYVKMIAMQSRTRRNAEDGTITLSLLCQATGFPWPVLKEFLDVLFDNDLTGNEKLQNIPDSKDFLKKIGILYKKTNQALLADYIMWQVVHRYVGALPDRYRPMHGDLLTSFYYRWYPRWKQCIDAMSKPFDMPLGLLYVDVDFNDYAKVEIKDMIENVRTSFIQNLPAQTWMDYKTQEMAKQKALAIAIEEIGYPDYIKDPVKLKEQYDSLNVSDSLMDNLKAANHFLRMRILRKFQRPVDKKKWTFGSPVQVNGKYIFSLNGIVFYAGIIQKPYYSTDYPRYLNYGAMGSIVGHEITHAFDDLGRLYDKNGNERDWWSAWSAENFGEKSNCFVEQYSKYKIFDKHGNGQKTLGDDIADNGGIKLAYEAYQRWTKENGTEKILPGLDLNPNQLFFLAFAQSWCSVYSKDAAYRLLETDEHSTGKYRIIGSLSNFKKFSEVYKCSPNSGMNPVEKCEIW